MYFRLLTCIFILCYCLQLISCQPSRSDPKTQQYHPTFENQLPYNYNNNNSTTTTATMSKSAEFLKLLALRRSYYTLTATSPIPDSQIHSIVKDVMLTVPSAFNTQSTRMVLALNDSHRQTWQSVMKAMKNKLGEEKYVSVGTEKKLAGFEKAYGTVLFYDDPTDVNIMKEKFPTYRDQFDPWSDHSNGMHQYACWVALEAEGFGANLQHYNPVADEGLAELFDVPKTWKLKAQLVFGGIEGDRPADKDKKSLEETVRVFGAKE